MTKTVVGLYEDLNQAIDTIRDLENSNFDRGNISLVANATMYADQFGGENANAANTGNFDFSQLGLPGDTNNLVDNLHRSGLAGIGRVIAGGPLLSHLDMNDQYYSGANYTTRPTDTYAGSTYATGAPEEQNALGGGTGVGGNLAMALENVGVPMDDANFYAEGVRRGGSLVTLKASDDDAPRAADIMNRHDPINPDERQASYQQGNWTTFDENATPYTGEQIDQERNRFATGTTNISEENVNEENVAQGRNFGRTEEIEEGEEETFPVVEEEMRVGKRAVKGGGVRVHTYTEEKPVEETVNLRQEHVDVERRDVDRPASEADMEKAFQDRTFEVDTESEEAVVEKRPHVVEEVDIHKDVENEPKTIQGTVRRTDVDVDKVGGLEGFETYEPNFRNHYQSTLSNRGYTYEQYRPAYEYGYQMRRQNRFSNMEWNQAEPQLRQSWQQQHANMNWNDFGPAVREGWNSGATR